MSLNVWEGDWYPARRIFDNLALVFRKIKWARQRVKRGFSDRDAYNLDYYYSELISESLNHLAEVTHSWPDKYFKTYEEWQTFLRETAECFRLYIDEPENKYEDAISYSTEFKEDMTDEYRHKMWECYKQECVKIEEAKRNKIEMGINRLFKVWEDLWD